MSGSPEPSPQPQPDALGIATDQAIAACDGDLRATVQALIVAKGLLEAELNDVYAAASKGLRAGQGEEEPTRVGDQHGGRNLLRRLTLRDERRGSH
jgi:hypothetical protein